MDKETDRRGQPAMDTTPHVLVPSEPTKIGQGYGLARVYAVGAKRVRVDILRGNSDAQSYYRADVWTDNGWTLVTALPREGADMVANPSYVCWNFKDDSTARHTHKDCVAAVEAIAARLVADATSILGA